jgi:parvulin-like peptidyl-prolyl isomerase
MKRIIVPFFFLALIAPFIFSQAIDKPVATVRLFVPQTITQRQLRMLVDPYEASQGKALTVENRLVVLQGLINRALIEQAADKDKVVVSDAELKAAIDADRQLKSQQAGLGRALTDAEYQAGIKNSGVDYNYYIAQLKYSRLTQLYAQFLNKDFMKVPQPTDDDARVYYEANKTKFVFDDMIHLRWIIVDTRSLTTPDERNKAAARAEDILKELRAGGKFEDLVTKYSDDLTSKYKGGDAGWVARNNDQLTTRFGADFFKAIFALKKGDMSGVIQTNLGFAIVQVMDRINAALLGFEDKIPPQNDTTVKDYIKSALTLQRQNDAFIKTLNDKIAALKQTAEIKIFEDNLTW